MPNDALQRILAHDREMPGLLPSNYLLIGQTLNEAINASWHRMLALWAQFDRIAPGNAESGTHHTREYLLLPLFNEQGYGRLSRAKPEERTIGGISWSISKFRNNSPIHLVGCNIPLDKAGPSRQSPWSLVQDFLNHSDKHLHCRQWQKLAPFAP